MLDLFLYSLVTLSFQFWPGMAGGVTSSLSVSQPVSSFNLLQQLPLLVAISWALKHVLSMSNSKGLRIFFEQGHSQLYLTAQE